MVLLLLESLFSFALFTFTFPLSIAQASRRWHASARASGVKKR